MENRDNSAAFMEEHKAVQSDEKQDDWLSTKVRKSIVKKKKSFFNFQNFNTSSFKTKQTFFLSTYKHTTKMFLNILYIIKYKLVWIEEHFPVQKKIN